MKSILREGDKGNFKKEKKSTVYNRWYKRKIEILSTEWSTCHMSCVDARDSKG